ncbi:MAG: IS630 family transposase, partial [Actinomycetales bacterium]|nr:IS630 family transposase [Actinomycetales bacterium]
MADRDHRVHSGQHRCRARRRPGGALRSCGERDDRESDSSTTRVHPQKGDIKPPQRNREDVVKARQDWRERQAALSKCRLIFLDETGSNAAMARRSGWAPRGQRVEVIKPYNATNVSLVGAMSAEGVLGTMAIEGAYDEAAFVAFLVHVLNPELNPGDVLVMDNLSVHKVAAVRRLLEEAGVTLLFQPPYSPEFNPI